MVNTKAKGTKLEHDFKRYFEKWGYKVIRSAGSFSTDLIAIKKEKLPVLINVKYQRKYCGPAERQELIDDSEKAGGIPILAYKESKIGCVVELLTSSKKTSLDNPKVLLVLEPLASCDSGVFDNWVYKKLAYLKWRADFVSFVSHLQSPACNPQAG